MVIVYAQVAIRSPCTCERIALTLVGFGACFITRSASPETGRRYVRSASPDAVAMSLVISAGAPSVEDRIAHRDGRSHDPERSGVLAGNTELTHHGVKSSSRHAESCGSFADHPTGFTEYPE